MRIEARLASGPAPADAPGAPTSRLRRGDVVAVVLLLALPVLIFGVPALLGHPILLGDDKTQNFPLRVLAGREIRAGHLPLLDPYIWSGAPLLAGWNAAAAYPLTWLFAVLPGTAAWTVNLVVTYAVSGLGMFCFLRALRLGSLASCLGALSFTFAGAMSAQVDHFGLVAGMSWVPVQLLGILRLSQDRPVASRLGWTAVLGVATGLVILAGEPRAIDDACVVVLIFAAWQVARLGRRAGPAAAWVVAGLVLGACLGAVQWLPGLANIGTSQRGANSMALFSSGSLPVRWLLLTLVPDLLGGAGSLSQPSFFASYNLTEVTSYVGILPLVAAFALLGRLQWRPRLPEWFVWHVTAAAGAVLALGGNTALGGLLYHLPLFGDQRLQSRNILVLDLALAVLLGYWADRPVAPVGERGPAALRADRSLRLPPLETVLGLVPALAAVAVIALGLVWGAGLLQWLGAGASQGAAVFASLKPWLLPYAVLGAGAAALVIAARHLRPGLRSGLIAGFVAVDLLVFTVLCVVQVRPGLPLGADVAAGSPGVSAGQAGSPGVPVSTAGAVSTVGTAGAVSTVSLVSSAGAVSTVSAVGTAGAAGTVSAVGTAGAESTVSLVSSGSPRPVAALGYPGRFAIYDPDLLDTGELTDLDPPDVNEIGSDPMPSVQGYSSTVDGIYASATGSHLATGDGQDTLAPGAVADGTLNQLDTTVLLTLPEYLVTGGANGAGGPAAGPPGTGGRDISASSRATWYLGAIEDVSRVEVPDADAVRDAAAGAEIGLETPDGSTRWFRARAISPSSLAITVAQPVASVAVTVQAPGRSTEAGGPRQAGRSSGAGGPGEPGKSTEADGPGQSSAASSLGAPSLGPPSLGPSSLGPSSLGPPSVTVAGGGVLVADGQLQAALVPPSWTFAGFDGSFAVFANHDAQPPLLVEALPGRSVSGAWITGSGGAPAEPAAATVFSPHGACVVRSVAAIPGWSATWQPRHGPAIALAVQRDGLIQAVDVPPGLGVVTWSYAPPGLAAGLALSLAATALILGCWAATLVASRRRRLPPWLTPRRPQGKPQILDPPLV